MRVKMIRLFSIAMIIAIALMCVYAEEELYSDRYDYVEIENILHNNKLRNQYFNCFMDTGSCVTADAKFFKMIFSEAIITKCRKCTEKQKEILNATVDWYTKNEPNNWTAIVAKAIENIRKQKTVK